MNKGKILIVLTSHDKLGETGKSTGFHYEELTTPYKAFVQSGYDVDIASIKGGKAPHDPSSLKSNVEDNPESVNWFINESDSKHKLENTLPVASVNPEHYEAIYLPGGHGTMWDFPNNENLNNLISNFYLGGKPVAAVCHGVAGFIGAKDENGNEIVKGKNINCFTDNEEKEVNLEDTVPFLLESKLKELGVNFECSDKFQAHISQNDNIITGQNPASCEGLANMILTLLKDKKHAA